MTMLPSVRSPVSFRDPLYEQLARAAEGQYGLPTGILDAIRTLGERSNADQTSSAGARSVYQFTPPTRRGMIKNYGVDPYRDAGSATEAAALHLLESYKRTGDWDKAIAGYHGGIRAEQGRRGPINRAYTKRVGYFNGEEPMPSLYPPAYYGGSDPLAPLDADDPRASLQPEPMMTAAPIQGDPGPSRPVTAAGPVASKKRGGILGALESVFMPDPHSKWGNVLRYGFLNAKYGAEQEAKQQKVEDINMQAANAKLRQLLNKGEFQIVGNNVLHIPADGGPAEIIAPPQTPGEKERLIEKWRNLGEGDPLKDMIERVLLTGNADEALASKERAASTRAAATTTSARIRANSSSKAGTMPPLPPGFSVVK